VVHGRRASVLGVFRSRRGRHHAPDGDDALSFFLSLSGFRYNL